MTAGDTSQDMRIWRIQADIYDSIGHDCFQYPVKCGTDCPAQIDCQSPDEEIIKEIKARRIAT